VLKHPMLVKIGALEGSGALHFVVDIMSTWDIIFCAEVTCVEV